MADKDYATITKEGYIRRLKLKYDFIKSTYKGCGVAKAVCAGCSGAAGLLAIVEAISGHYGGAAFLTLTAGVNFGFYSYHGSRQKTKLMELEQAEKQIGALEDEMFKENLAKTEKHLKKIKKSKVKRK